MTPPPSRATDLIIVAAFFLRFALLAVSAVLAWDALSRRRRNRRQP